jgi:hypothetical protein
MSFKTHAEIFQALLDGKKLSHRDSPNHFIQIIGGIIFNSDNWVVEYLDLSATCWSIYEEPKPKKQVWQWRYLFQNGHWYADRELLTEEEAAEEFEQHKAYEKHAGPFYVDQID